MLGEDESYSPWRGDLTWIEIDQEALSDNIRALKAHLSAETLIAPAVKSNAYGHGLLIAAEAFIKGGAQWLCVHTLQEAISLREAGTKHPLYLFGPTLVGDIEEAARLHLHLVLYQRGHLERLVQLSQSSPSLVSRLKLHLKIETGNHRQGITLEEALEFVDTIKSNPPLRLVGVTSHFANIEDTTDHSYAETQLERLTHAVAQLEERWGQALVAHIANSAASLLWPLRALDIARVGIASYGLWPSVEVRDLVSQSLSPMLRPALSWRAKVVQIKEVACGEPIGYGCTYVTDRPSMIAIIPVGYFEGYDRGLSNRGEVLINGQRAPIRGRVCMNICMADVTDHDLVEVGDRVTLLGQDGDEEISAEEIATRSDTINYEVIARIAAHLPRYVVSP